MIKEIMFKNLDATNAFTGISFRNEYIYCWIAKSSDPVESYFKSIETIPPVEIYDSQVTALAGTKVQFVLDGDRLLRNATNHVVFVNKLLVFSQYTIDIYFDNRNGKIPYYYWGEYNVESFNPFGPDTYLKFMGSSGPFYPKKHPDCLMDRPYVRIKKSKKIDNYPLTDDPLYIVGQARFKIKNRLWGLEKSEPNLIVRDNTNNGGNAIIYTYKNGKLVTLYTANAYADSFLGFPKAQSPKVFYEETTGIYFITGESREYQKFWRAIGLCRDGYKIDWNYFSGIGDPKFYVYDTETKKYYYASLGNDIIAVYELTIISNKVVSVLKTDEQYDYLSEILEFVKIKGKLYYGKYRIENPYQSVEYTCFGAFEIVKGKIKEIELSKDEKIKIKSNPTEIYDIYSNTKVRLEDNKLIKTDEDGRDIVLVDDSETVTKPKWSIACNYMSI